MAYKISTNTYVCDLCGFEQAWDACDDIHGTTWECDECGKHFCSACAEKAIGKKAFYLMLKENTFVCCPECFKEMEGNN